MEEKEVIATEKETSVSKIKRYEKEIEYIDLEVKSGEHTYFFKIPMGSPIGHAYDAAFAVLNRIVEIAKEAADKAAPKPVSETASEKASAKTEVEADKGDAKTGA